jgi:hypothetical protein
MTGAPPTVSSPGTDVVPRDLELDRLARLGKWLALSESGDRTPEAKGAAAALRFYYADALGLPPLAAAELSVIDGKLVVSALLLRALAEQRGYRVEREAIDANACTATVWRRASATGSEVRLGSSTFTMEDARRAGLIRDRSAWKTYPERMLWARASALAIRDYAPAVAVGVLTREEISEAPADATPPPEAEPADLELDATEEYDAAQSVFAPPPSVPPPLEDATEAEGENASGAGETPNP